MYSKLWGLNNKGYATVTFIINVKYIDNQYNNVCLYPYVISTVASFTKEVNRRLAKRPLVFNGCLANRGWTSLVK